MLNIAESVGDGGVLVGLSVPGLCQIKSTQFLLLVFLLAVVQDRLLNAFMASVFDLCHFGLELFPKVALRLWVVGPDHNFIHKEQIYNR